MKKLIVGVTVVMAVIAIAGLFLPVGQSVVNQIVGGASPDLYSPYFNINGVKNFYNSVGLVQATTTICSIKSPSATSTLGFASVQFETASTSATYVELGRATTRYATTTSINIYTVGASAKASIVASSTGSVAGNATIFPPSTYFNVKTSWATAATALTVPVGRCQAVFTQL